MADRLQDTSLTGKLLIAMPGMGDPRFLQSVIYMCAHSEDGAMGLIINKPSKDIRLKKLMDQLDIEVTPDMVDMPVQFGGPVETGRGFVLHSPDYSSVVTTLEVNEDFHMTATLDILEDIAKGKGPQEKLMCLGYAGWGPNQLEGELAQNGWLVCDADPLLVFGTPNVLKWSAALSTLGVSPHMLSAEGGSA